MKCVVTGSSSGIGLEIAKRFLKEGYEVIGIDKNDQVIADSKYTHIKKDLRDFNEIDDLGDFEILINNAGVQDDNESISVNLESTIEFTERFAFNSKALKSIIFIASSSAESGFEFPRYSASKAGIVGYMRNVAWRMAKRGVTVNSLSFGGVYTPLNEPVTSDIKLFKKIMDVTPLKKWMDTKECADWAYFMTVINRSASGENILIDNGERNLNCTFVWPEEF